MIKNLVKREIAGCVLERPLRDAYQFVFNRTFLNYRLGLRSFYAQFVAAGDLVFDIGANVGSYTELFLGLGARVVAAEPNVGCIPILEAKGQSTRLIVEGKAIGSSESEAPFFSCNDSNTHSSLSQKWVSIAQNLPRLQGKKWQPISTVPVTTLDHLMAKYGEPTFIKIDVEGYEEEVLKGLDHLPQYLSFEFISELLDTTMQCLNSPCFSPETEFNLIVNDPGVLYPPTVRFRAEQWMTAENLIKYLKVSGLKDAQTYGEIFARNTTAMRVASEA